MPEPRASILTTPFDPHGGPDGSGRKLIDFSVNSNPFGPPEGLLEQLAEVDVASYPDPTCREARALAGLYHQLSPKRVTFGNGTAELIHRLAACYLNAGAKAVIATPAFGEYARASRLHGARVVTVDAYTNRPAPDEAALVAAVRRERPTLVWLCHPNNPSGHAWHADQLAKIARACAEVDALLVIDAAYLELSEVADKRLPKSAVQLYSLTKTFCIPGVRAGYALAKEPVIEALERAAPPWQAGAHAQLAARWAFSEDGKRFVQATVPELLALRRGFQGRLRALGYRVEESRANFFLVDVGDAAAFKTEAEGAGFRVREGSSFGLPAMIRLATRKPAANAELISWLVSRLDTEGI
jgi:histidinol-phosphate/aromatic aminotransferase/cobyric acid decarboxylase-like protein